MKSSNESKYGFWGALARKAKAIIEDDNEAQQPEAPGRTSRQGPGTVTGQVRINNQNCIYIKEVKSIPPCEFCLGIKSCKTCSKLSYFFNHLIKFVTENF